MCEQICDISQNAANELKNFRFKKNATNCALILKIDREKKLVVVEDEIEDISLEELQDQLCSHQPRYLIYSYKMIHPEGRISYPMLFIFITPRDSQIELQILYAATKVTLAKMADLTRVYEIRELEELTEEWLKEKLK